MKVLYIFLRIAELFIELYSLLDLSEPLNDVNLVYFVVGYFV